jgi:FAD/FMN-containing dehydrogenase
VLAGEIVYPGETAADVLRHWWDTIRDAPDELAVWVSLGPCPAVDMVPEAHHGEPIVAVSPVYAGDVEAGYEAIEPLRTFGDPLVEIVEPQPYVELQQASDENYPAGDRYYWKSHNFREPADGVFDVLAEYALTVPVPASGMSGFNTTHLGGAVSRVPNDATAYPHRDADFLVNIPTRWQDPARDDEFISWTRSLFDDLAPYATGGTYVNLISEREGEEAMAYRENYDRMVELKNRYDPGNLFRMNQNVQPTGQASLSERR